MKEIMNEWRSYLSADRSYLSEVTAIGASILLGRKKGTVALFAGNEILKFMNQHVPWFKKILLSIEGEMVKRGMSNKIFFEGIDKIFEWLISAGLDKMISKKPVQDAIIRFFFFLSKNSNLLFNLLPQLARGVPFVSIAINSYEIYEQMKIVKQEIERASTFAAKDSEEKNSSLSFIRYYEELIKAKGYENIYGSFNKSQRDKLYNAFNIAKKQFPNIIEFNPNAYKLITNYDKQRSSEYILQHGASLPED